MNLTLLEKFVILIIHPVRGRVMVAGNHLAKAVAVAAITDLLFSDRAVLDGKCLILKSYKLKGSVVYDTMVSKINEAREPRKFSYWSGKFFFKGGLFLKETLKELVFKSILFEQEHRFLNIFPYKRYFFIKPDIRKEILDSLYPVIYERQAPEPQQAVLLQLLASCNLYGVLARNRGEIRIYRSRLKEIRRDQSIPAVRGGVIREVRNAAGSSELIPGT